MDLFQNPELRLAYEFVQNTGKHLFLTGRAGTGKTTFLHNLRKKSWKRMVIVAPTGVAAINAGGVTIHSFFQLPFGPRLPDNDGSTGGGRQTANGLYRFGREKINIIKSLDLLVIDEISMVRADLLDGIDSVLRRYRDRHKPFGGVQLLMIGDLQQLAPVVKEDEWQILQPYYESVFFFSSLALRQTDYVSIELLDVFRQTDRHFLDLLNKVRENRLDEASLKAINDRYKPGFNPPDSEGYITLTTHNSQARSINEARLDSISGEEHVFKATVEGDFPSFAFPADNELKIRKGAQVMFIKNDPSPERLFYNGKIGRLNGIDEDTLWVTCPGEDTPIPVVPLEWQNTKYTIDEQTKEISESVTGSFRQYPLKLAWAVTIHKSQGLTFEKLIVDARAAFTHGQVYVALSRCKTLEGLVLSTLISPAAIKSNNTIGNYTIKIKENKPDDATLENCKAEFHKSLIMELFDFSPILRSLGRLERVVDENSGSVDVELAGLLSEMRTRLTSEIATIGDKFRHQADALLKSGGIKSSFLQERLSKAALYFIPKLNEIAWSVIGRMRIESDNKSAGKLLNEALSRLRTDVYVIIKSLESATEKFCTEDYLRIRARSVLEVPAIAHPGKKQPSSGASRHPGLLASIKSWRDKLARESGSPVSRVLPRRTMIEISNELPSTEFKLLQIHGMGKKRVNDHGEALTTIVRNYCSENNISTGRYSLLRSGPDGVGAAGTSTIGSIRQTDGAKPEQRRVRDSETDLITGEEAGTIPGEKLKGPTKQVSFSMFKSGMTVAEIAGERGLAKSTIEGHLAHFVGTGELPIFRLLPPEKIATIAEYFISTEDGGMKRALEVLGEDYSWGELNWVLKHIEFMEKSGKADE